jgi:predicted enzyme related to lactoylglutathione lyase
MRTFVDLSHEITDGMVTYPGLPVPHMGVVLEREASRGKYAPGVEFIIGSIEMCTNTGTYLDTPFHRYEDGYDLAGLALTSCADLRAFAVLPDRPTICEIVLDCADVRALSTFWAVITGGTANVRHDGWATVTDPKPGGVLLAFQRVPEPKTAKNRTHIDLFSDDIPGDTARAVALGATALGGIVHDPVGDFQVLTDPEGNEFCFVS